MIKRIKTLVFSLSICALVVPSAFAATSEVGGVTMRNLIGSNPSDEPAIIASNPLYDMVDFFRGVNEPFVSGRIAKVSARLAILDRKAAELLKMRIVAPNNEKMSNKATGEYQTAVYQYGFAAIPLTAADIAADSRAEKFIDTIVNSTFTHIRLMDELLSSTTKTKEQAVLTDMLDHFADASVKVFAGAIGAQSVSVRLTEATRSTGITGVRNAEALALLAKHAAALGYNDLSQEFLSLRLSMLNNFASQLADAGVTTKLAAGVVRVAGTAIGVEAQDQSPVNSDVLSDFSMLVGSRAERVQTISYMLSLPQLAGNSDLINLRNQLLIQVFSR